MNRLDQEIKKVLLASLSDNKGIQTRVAKDLGISRSTVGAYLKKYGIKINKRIVTIKSK